ncbi:winged helix-turn-helix domain-containing protein [Entomohabitans teleogrylli]|uniref:winged helix-turn-helix domain-containing protein n=1 Tax=Entomohabitans teleogrylli TaxID=1384589 RepID=UPI00073D31AB|nr:winged helix-turn-helix domain-containing protein [Entomohabitans teleogrylli]
MSLSSIVIADEIIFYVNENRLISLHSGGDEIILNDPTARCFQLLIERYGKVVSRDDFLEEVWMSKGIVVSHNTFYQNISLLRKSLKKAGVTQDIIITVRRKGFTLAPGTVVNYVKMLSPEQLESNAEKNGDVVVELFSDELVKDMKSLPVDSIKKGGREYPLCLAKVTVLLLILFSFLEVISLYLRHF